MSDGFTATSSQTIGPFFHFALTAQPNGLMADRSAAAGERIRLRIRLFDGNGDGVTDAMIELQQDGVFGRMPTGPDGSCEFETLLPRSDAGAAAHIGVWVFARGLLRQLHTRIYFPLGEGVGADPVLSLVPDDRRGTLMAAREAAAASWHFDIHLQGPRETVFFDA